MAPRAPSTRSSSSTLGSRPSATVVGEGRGRDARSRFGGCTPVWASPEALRLQRASRADPILARDHDLWSFALVAFELFVGDASLTAKERAKPTGQGLRGLRPSEHLGSLYEGDVRQWSSAAVREWAGEKPKLDKIAKSFEEQGVDGAALLRYADDRPKLKADFKVTHGVAIKLGNEMDRAVRRWPRPIPEDLVALLRKCVAVEPSERFESATPIVAELERLALAAHAAILDDARAHPRPDDGACLRGAERGDDDRARRRRAGRLPPRLGLRAPRAALAVRRRPSLAGADALRIARK